MNLIIDIALNLFRVKALTVLLEGGKV